MEQASRHPYREVCFIIIIIHHEVPIDNPLWVAPPEHAHWQHTSRKQRAAVGLDTKSGRMGSAREDHERSDEEMGGVR
jgi:hypothetical protein